MKWPWTHQQREIACLEARLPISGFDEKTSSAVRLNRGARTLKHSPFLWFAAIMLGVCITGQAFGQASLDRPPPGSPLPPADSPLPWETGVFGNWDARSEMADEGFTWFGFSQFHVPANVSGGIKTGVRPLARFYGAVNLDTEKLGWWEGGQIRSSFTGYAGKNLGEIVGTPYNTSTLFQEPDIKFNQFYFGQWFADKQVHLKIGRIAANNEDFAANNIGGLFDSVAYNGAPGNMYINNRAFGSLGVTQWGARLRIQPTDTNYTVRLGVYNTSEDFSELQAPNQHGTNFGFDPGKSLMVAGELRYHLNRKPGDTGLPGEYTIGALYDTGPRDRLDVAGQTTDGNFGLYLLFDQMVYREDPDTDEGLWAFTQFSMNPDQKINPFPYLWSWGLAYKGLFSGRPDDVTAFANYYNFSSDFISGNTEVQFALVQKFVFESWLQIAPEISYVHRPGGTGGIDDAFILNLQTIITF